MNVISADKKFELSSALEDFYRMIAFHYEDLISYIANRTGFEKSVIESIMAVEEEFLNNLEYGKRCKND